MLGECAELMLTVNGDYNRRVNGKNRNLLAKHTDLPITFTIKTRGVHDTL